MNITDLTFLDNKKILVTGGSGTIGLGLIKTLLLYTNAKTIRILANDENGLHTIGASLSSHENIRPLLGDVRDKARVMRACEEIDIVFHLAALKHVSLSEYNPFECVNTNVIGTQNVVDAAIENNAEKVILTSSDKAANPNNVLGATKLLAEKLITAANIMKGKRKTIFSSVRFGNVLGSRGSVIPLIKQQLRSGKNATITHPDMTRFVMCTDDALNLLFRASELMRGGEVFVIKMPAIRIKDLFSTVANHLSGGILAEDNIEFDVIGPQPGEKLHEDLLTQEESRRTLEIPDMFVIIPDIAELSENLIRYYTKIGAKPVPIAPYSSKMGTMLDTEDISKLIARIEL